MKKKFIFIIVFAYFLLIIPSIIFASCDQALKDCTSEVEKQYEDCAKISAPALAMLTCYWEKGYKPGSWDYMKCEEEIIKKVREECKKQYQKHTDNCYSAYKKCRKGDIFGKVWMEMSWAGEDAQHIYEGSAYFTIMGFWKYKPEETTELYKNYRPEGLQMMTRYEEKVDEKYPDNRCRPLYQRYQGGGARVLMVDPNVDYRLNPAGRLYIINIPSKPPKEIAKFLPEEIKKFYRGPTYGVGYGPGKVIEIEGIEKVDRNYPKCLIYKKSIIEIIFGEFFITDNLIKGEEMSGSESWVGCGNVRSGSEGEMGFVIRKDYEFVLEKGEPEYTPDKRDKCDDVTCKIKIYWKFYLIK